MDAYPPSDDVSPRPGYGSSVTVSCACRALPCSLRHPRACSQGDSGVEDESLGSVDRRYAEGHGGAGGDDDGASGQSGTYTVDILQRRIKYVLVAKLRRRSHCDPWLATARLRAGRWSRRMRRCACGQLVLSCTCIDTKRWTRNWPQLSHRWRRARTYHQRLGWRTPALWPR